MTRGNPKLQPVKHHLLGDGNLDDVITTPVAGYFRTEVDLLEDVNVGQQLGTIRNVFGRRFSKNHYRTGWRRYYATPYSPCTSR